MVDLQTPLQELRRIYRERRLLRRVRTEAMRNPMLMEFKNGWTIEVHLVRNGEVYFRKWPPGVSSMGFLERLQRMSVRRFNESLSEEEYA